MPDMRSVVQMLRVRAEQGATREELELELRRNGHLGWNGRSSRRTSGRSSGRLRGRRKQGVNLVTQEHEMKIAILTLATRVMDAIEERAQAEADLVARYHHVVRKTADTVEVGGESL